MEKYKAKVTHVIILLKPGQAKKSLLNVKRLRSIIYYCFHCSGKLHNKSNARDNTVKTRASKKYNNLFSNVTYIFYEMKTNVNVFPLC